MKRITFLLLAALAIFYGSAHLPDDYVWETMSHDSSGSMPVGGGDVGLNVWVEDGDLLFYISHNGTFDEHGTLLKQGRVRISIPGDSLAPFSQRIRLSEGWCEVGLNGSHISVWADVHKPVVHVEVESPRPTLPEISYESWRHADRPFRKGEGRQNAWKWASPKGKVTTRDSIRVSDGDITFFHHNPIHTIFDKTVEAEGLGSLRDRIANPLANLVSGGCMEGDNLRFIDTEDGVYAGTDYRAWKFGAVKPSRKHHYTILLHNAQTEDASEWERGIDSLKGRINLARDRKASHEWWKRFWERSYITAPEGADTTIVRMARNLELFRYMLGCNARGEYPTKFNGGLFTFDPIFVDSSQTFTPDYRNWGGTTMTAQNQRLVYWPMLKSGDTDMMIPQLDLYLRMLPTAELRTRAYWGHKGGCFGEQIEIFGLPNLMEYGTKRPDYADPGVEYNAWLEYEWDTVLEFCQMALEAARYAGIDITRYHPLIESVLTFFDEHYRLLASRRGSKELDGDGKLIIYPGSGCETYKMATNAASTIAALRRVASSYADHLDTSGDTTSVRWRQLLGRIPEIPLRELGGYRMIAPAKAWERINNVETPQLYPVWPWRYFGTFSPDTTLTLARNTYMYDPDALRFRSSRGWKQDNIWAACLGLSDEAFELTSAKLADGAHRFPAFFGPGFDWTPDHNWGGSAMIGMQEMLMQTHGDSILLFPAWPLDRDITFKLHAPHSTIVEAKLIDGRLADLNVTPPYRASDIILPEPLRKQMNEK